MSVTPGGRAEGRPCEILLVEDNAKDVRLVQEVLREQNLPCRLHIASNGEQALAMLRRAGDYAELPCIDLVLLDINLPIVSGIDVLNQVKSDPRLCLVPVLMLTTSKADSDVLTCYTLHANSYMVKPADFDEFTQMLCAIHEYWLGHSELPGQHLPRRPPGAPAKSSGDRAG